MKIFEFAAQFFCLHTVVEATTESWTLSTVE